MPRTVGGGAGREGAAAKERCEDSPGDGDAQCLDCGGRYMNLVVDAQRVKLYRTKSMHTRVNTHIYTLTNEYR